ncbi:IS256 family transposase [Nodosilinea sp. P-1105]|nr:IS256 family transposase [Nodosilinea sp. P-1105]
MIDQSPEDILGESGLLKQLTQRLVERALAGELNHHLKTEALASADETEDKPRNSRNGYSAKTVQSKHGSLDLSIPRDRQSTFEPVLVPKHQRRLRGLDEKIVTLYARGLSTRDIALQLEELYGAQVSASLISEVTDTVSEDVKAWQNRPLDELYPIVYLDALYVNIKVAGRVSKRAVYVVLGINREGSKDVLGLWIGEAEAEGAKFWLKVIKIKAVFPDEESVFKLMYLALDNISKRWTRPIRNWKAATSHFAILFPERFKL